MSNEPRTAVITGASSGLGAAMALAMAAQGWKISIGARREERLTETAEKARAGGAADVFAGELDVTDNASVRAFFDASEAAIGIADVIVNNAGASRVHYLGEVDPEWLQTEVNTNLVGPMLVTDRAIQPLLAEGRMGDVVMITSDAAKRPRPAQLAYGASKAGLETYADTLSMMLEGTGIRVIKLRLGPAVSEFGLSMDLTPEGTSRRTAYWAQFGLRDARMMINENMGILMPDDVAATVIHAVSQPRHVLVDTIELQPAVPQKPRA